MIRSLTLLVLPLALAGCTQPVTEVAFKGTVCGGPVEAQWTDSADRGGLQIKVDTKNLNGQTCYAEVTSIEKKSSDVVAVQAEAARQNSENFGKLLDFAVGLRTP